MEQHGWSRVSDRTLGQGQAIEVTYPDGYHDGVTLFPGLAFALIRSSLHNGGTEATITQTVRPFSGTVDLGVPASQLKTFGTGGLLDADKNPGSYAWLAVVEPSPAREWSSDGSRRIEAVACCSPRQRGMPCGWRHRSTTAGCGSPGQDGAVRDPDHWVVRRRHAWAWRHGRIQWRSGTASACLPSPWAIARGTPGPMEGPRDQRHLAEQSAFAARTWDHSVSP